MQIQELVAYIGPSIYSREPVVRLTVDLGSLDDWSTVRLGADFTHALLEILPGLRDHAADNDASDEFIARLADGEGMHLAHVVMHVAIELQRLASRCAGDGDVVPGPDAGTHHLLYEYDDPEIGTHAGGLAVVLVATILPSKLRASLGMAERIKILPRIKALLHSAEKRALDAATAALVGIAESRGIPCERVNWHRSFVRLGHGKFQKLLGEGVSGGADHVGHMTCHDRAATNSLLGDLGVPVPRFYLLESDSQVEKAAEDLGYPVVVRPNRGGGGHGVTIGVTGGKALHAAFQQAKRRGAEVVVEQLVAGDDHRMLVVAGRFVAAARCFPARVVGDGLNTVAQLLQRANDDPRRGDRLSDGLVRLALDAESDRVLGAAGLTRDSVPDKGAGVVLGATADVSFGGTAVDVTDDVHPDNRGLAERVGTALGLDVASVHFVSADVSQSHLDGIGAVDAVDASPDLRPYWVAEGPPRDVNQLVFDRIYPPGSPSRVPIAAVTGTNGKTTTVRMVSRILELGDRCVGMGSTDGVYFDGRKSVAGDFGSTAGAQVVLRDPRPEVAVLEMARGGILRRGVGFDRCDVGAVLNVTMDHLGDEGIQTVEQMARVKRLLVELAHDTAVLNAEDPHCVDMAAHTSAKHICWVAMDARNPVVTDHVGKGGRAAVIAVGDDGPTIVILEGETETAITSERRIPATLDGLAAHNLQNALFAAAIAHGMGAPADHIRRALEGFDCSYEHSPARTNIYDGHPFKVIFDYGHNPAAVETMCRMVERIPVDGRRIVIFGQPGDREPTQTEEVARIVSGVFDHFVCRSNILLRGRDPEDIPKMSCEALRANGITDDQMTVILDEAEAIEGALRLARPGDLVMVFTAAKDNLWPIITDFVPDFDASPSG